MVFRLLALISIAFAQNSGWHLDFMGIDSPIDCSKKVIALIDTGSEMSHPDLSGTFWVNSDEIPNNGKDDDQNGFIDDVNGYDFIKKTGTPTDEIGHGTQLHGVIASTKTGICASARIMVLKVATKQKRSLEAIYQAINYAVQNGADIISMSQVLVISLGFPPRKFKRTIQKAIDQGVLFVNAAGNFENVFRAGINTDADKAMRYIFPASFNLKNQLTVGSFSYDGRFSFLSPQDSKKLHLYAPGERIYTTTLAGKYRFQKGSSVAAPMVAAIAAHLWGENPELSMTEVRKKLINNSLYHPTLANSLSSRVLNFKTLMGEADPGSDQVVHYTDSKLIDIESEHPYPVNTRKTWKIEIPGAKWIKLHFRTIHVGDGIQTGNLQPQFLALRSSDETIYDLYSGRFIDRRNNIESRPIKGDTVIIDLDARGGVAGNMYGFKLFKVSYQK